jgi:hypothetical protein
VFAVNQELPKRRISSGERLTEVLRDHGGEIPGPRLSFRQRARPHPPEIRDAEPGDTDENGNREYRDEELGTTLEGGRCAELDGSQQRVSRTRDPRRALPAR